MPDTRRQDPFKPNQPSIPGVPTTPKTANTSDAASSRKDTYSQGLPTWIVLVLAGVLFVIIAGLWWNRRVRTEEAAPAPAATVSVPDPAPVKPAEHLPVGPGPVATVDELAKPWSSKRFLYRDPGTNDASPAIVVHLPNGIYWGFSVREPFGTCEMEYVPDLKKLETEYKVRVDHPMVVDPCNHAVFDLMRYGSGPNGLVRGEIVAGAAVRPPMAIEMKAQDRKVIAVRME
jgi:hypothetical protein